MKFMVLFAQINMNIGLQIYKTTLKCIAVILGDAPKTFLLY